MDKLETKEKERLQKIDLTTSRLQSTLSRMQQTESKTDLTTSQLQSTLLRMQQAESKTDLTNSQLQLTLSQLQSTLSQLKQLNKPSAETGQVQSVLLEIFSTTIDPKFLANDPTFLRRLAASPRPGAVRMLPNGVVTRYGKRLAGARQPA